MKHEPGGTRIRRSGPVVARLRNIVPGLLILALALWACLVVLWTCQAGIGLGSDSAVYIAAARNLLEGNGLSWLSGGGEVRPMTLHAPLLSIVLAGVEAVGINGIEWARWLNAICLGLTVVLVGVLARRCTASQWLGVIAALITAVTGELLQVHAWLMSEPLFIPLMLGGVVALHTYVIRGGREWQVLGALAFGLAALTRYAGLALPVAGTAFLWIDPRTTWRRRMVETAWMLSLGLMPLMAWMMRNAILTGQTGGRSFGPNLALWPLVRDETVSIVLKWFVPLRLVEFVMARPVLVLMVVCIAVMAAAMLAGKLLRRSTRLTVVSDPGWSGLLLMFLCSVALLGVVFSAALLSSPGADVIDRVLSPVYPLLVVVLVEGLAWLWGKRRVALRVGIALLVLLLLLDKTMYEYWTIRGSIRGLGYTSPAWRTSATIREVIAMDPDAIYTNDTAAVYLLAGRPAYLIPSTLYGNDPVALAAAEQAMLTVLKNRRDAVVVFGTEALPGNLLGEGLVVAAQLDDGVILVSGAGDR